MTEDLKVKFKYLESIDLAPATREAEHIRAAILGELPAGSESNRAYFECQLIEADIIDEQRLLARLKALRHGDMLAIPRVSLANIIVQRVMAKHLFQLECAKAAGEKEHVEYLESHIATIQSRLLEHPLAMCPELLIVKAIFATEELIQTLEQELQKLQNLRNASHRSAEEQPEVAIIHPVDIAAAEATSDISSDMMEESFDDNWLGDPPDDSCGMEQVPDTAVKREIAKMLWVGQKEMQAKYRGYFRHYLKAERNLL